jgi:hypothetical protein
MSDATVTLTLTLEQATLCKAALLGINLQGSLTQVTQIVALVHETIGLIDTALGSVSAPADADEPNKPTAAA